MSTLVKQNGMTFGGFISVAIAFVVVAIFALKLTPAYLEDAKIQKAFDAIVKDPAMQNATLAEIKDAYYKRATTMDNVTVVSQNDIEVSKDGGKLSLSASYNTKIPLFGNASLLIEFNPHAPK